VAGRWSSAFAEDQPSVSADMRLGATAGRTLLAAVRRPSAPAARSAGNGRAWRVIRACQGLGIGSRDRVRDRPLPLGDGVYQGLDHPRAAPSRWDQGRQVVRAVAIDGVSGSVLGASNGDDQVVRRRGEVLKRWRAVKTRVNLHTHAGESAFDPLTGSDRDLGGERVDANRSRRSSTARQRVSPLAAFAWLLARCPQMQRRSVAGPAREGAPGMGAPSGRPRSIRKFSVGR